MKNVSQDVSQGFTKNKGAKKMEKAITEFIINNDFLMEYITDSVKEKIYTQKTYNDGMIEDVIVNDLESGFSGGYITDFIIDEIDVYNLVDKIDELHIEDFMELAEQSQQRNY